MRQGGATGVEDVTQITWHIAARRLHHQDVAGHAVEHSFGGAADQHLPESSAGDRTQHDDVGGQLRCQVAEHFHRGTLSELAVPGSDRMLAGECRQRLANAAALLLEELRDRAAIDRGGRPPSPVAEAISSAGKKACTTCSSPASH